MVRIKHRYLLVDILYPSPSASSSASASSSTGDDVRTHLQFHAPTSDALTPALLAKMVREEVAEVFGDWGVGRLGGAGAGGVSVKYLSPATSTAIIRCPRASFRLVWAALTYMSHVPGAVSKRQTASSAPGSGTTRPCVFRVLRVSGTMRKAEEEAIRRARREIVRMRRGEEVGVLGGLVGAVGAGAGAEAVVDDEERAMDDVGVLEDEEEDAESMSE
ncbi:Rpp14 family [Thermoascus aurantiacus ATCC 26904]